MPDVPKSSSAPSGTLYAVPSATVGVAFNPPPLALMPSIAAAIEKAAMTIPPEQNGALVAVVDEGGANAAIVQRIGGNFAVTAWIGRKWVGGNSVGAAVKMTW